MKHNNTSYILATSALFNAILCSAFVCLLYSYMLQCSRINILMQVTVAMNASTVFPCAGAVGFRPLSVLKSALLTCLEPSITFD